MPSTSPISPVRQAQTNCSSPSTDPISRLPASVSTNIFSLVPTPSLASSARVSKSWHALIDGRRDIWLARLRHEELLWGDGTEEEEEEKVKQRWEVRDRLDREHARESEAPAQEELRTTVRRRSHPLKHVYRIRRQTRVNWEREDLAGGKLSFEVHDSHVVTCMIINGDTVITSSDDRTILVSNLKDGRTVHKLTGHEGGVWALKLRGDTLVSGSTDRTVRVWSLAKGKQTHIFHGHSSTVRAVEIVDPVRQPDGSFLPPQPLIVSGSRDSTARVWKFPEEGSEGPSPTYVFHPPHGPPVVEPVPSEKNPHHLHLLTGHTNAIRELATHGKYAVTASYDQTLRVWDIIEGRCVHVLEGHTQKIYSVVIDSKMNRVFSGSMDSTIIVHSLLTGALLQTLSGHTSLVGLLTLNVPLSTHLISAAVDSTIKVWTASPSTAASSTELYTCAHTLAGHQGAITCLAADETRLIAGSEGSVKLWDIHTGNFKKDLVSGPGAQGVWQVAFDRMWLVCALNRNGRTEIEVLKVGKHGYDDDGAGDEELDRLLT